MEEMQLNFNAEVTEIVQIVITKCLRSDLGASGTAFALGACLATAIAILNKVSPNTSETENRELMLDVFHKGLTHSQAVVIGM